MIDYALEQRLKDVASLLEHWGVFREYYKIGEAKEKPTRDQEDAFLECKKKIAMLHDEFMETIPQNDTPSNRKKQKDGKSIIKHVIQCVTIKHIHTFYSNQHKEFERDWNDAYLLLNETIEKLEKKRDELKNVSYTQMATAEMKKKIQKQIGDFIKGPIPRYAGGALFFILIPIILQLTGLYDIQNVPVDFPKTAKFYYPLENAYRSSFNPDLKYTNLEFTARVEGNLPNNYEFPSRQPQTGVMDAIAVVNQINYSSGLDLTSELQVAKGFSHENYIVENGQPLDMYIFLLSTNSDAEAAYKVYLQWFNNLTEEEKSQINSSYSYFYTNNIFIFISSQSTNARNHFKQRVWGVRN